MIIGGGQSSRMGRDKSQLEFSGRKLLERAIDATVFCSEVVVVAPKRELRARADWPPVRFTLEDPPLGGPVAGIAAGVAALAHRADDTRVVVLPVDLPRPDAATRFLRAAQFSGDGAVLEDESGWPQYLMGIYRLGALRRAISEPGGVRDVSMRRFGQRLDVARLPVANSHLVDVDTPSAARKQGISVPQEKNGRKDDPEVFARLDKWQRELREKLNIPAEVFDQEKVLELSGIIAKEIARPAVPVTSYLIGIAIGKQIATGVKPEQAIERVFGVVAKPSALLERPAGTPDQARSGGAADVERDLEGPELG